MKNTLQNYATKKTLYSIVISSVFLLIAAASAVVKFEQHPQEIKNVTISSKPLITLKQEDEFCVLRTDWCDDKLANSIENILAGQGFKIEDWTIAKQTYAEQILKNSTNRSTISYYVLVEKVENAYYYRLFQSTGKMVYADKSITFNPEDIKSGGNFLAAPFKGQKNNIDLSFTNYKLTLQNNEYNTTIRNSKNIDEIIAKSNEIIKTTNDDAVINSSKKSKEKSAYFNDKYAIILNLATASLIKRDFQSCKKYLKDADQIFPNVNLKGNPEAESQYAKKLLQTCKSYESAIQDSINLSLVKNDQKRKTISIKNEKWKEPYRDVDYMNNLKSSYCNAITRLFKDNYSRIDIFDRKLVDDILLTNSNISQQSRSENEGADFIMSVFLDKWEVKDPSKEIRKEKKTSITGNVEVIEIIEYQNHINAQITIRFTKAIGNNIVSVEQYKHQNISKGSTPVKLNVSQVYDLMIPNGSLAKQVKNLLDK